MDAVPFSGENHGGYVTSIETGVIQPTSQTVAEVDVVSADYLRTMGVRLVQGRWFREEVSGVLSWNYDGIAKHPFDTKVRRIMGAIVARVLRLFVPHEQTIFGHKFVCGPCL